MIDNTHIIKFKKLDECAKLPQKAHSKSVGYDMWAISCEYDEEHDTYIYHTGLACETSSNDGETTICNIYPRSSNCKTEGYLTNSVGIVDSDEYRGEIQARWKNRTSLQTMIQLETLKRLYENLNKPFPNHFMTFETMYPIVANEFVLRAKNLEFAPYNPTDKIMQMVIHKVPDYEVKEIQELNMDTERKEGGFGSSGK